MEITESENNKTYKYLGINEANSISRTMNKKKKKRILLENKNHIYIYLPLRSDRIWHKVHF